ncbi:hypothetical protein EB50_01396 [Enterococcus faecium]|nr:hypothetical protein EB50_01396 [Enterococcus faecium]
MNQGKNQTKQREKEKAKKTNTLDTQPKKHPP